MRKIRQDIHKNQDKIKQNHCFNRRDIAKMAGLSKKVRNMTREREDTKHPARSGPLVLLLIHRTLAYQWHLLFGLYPFAPIHRQFLQEMCGYSGVDNSLNCCWSWLERGFTDLPGTSFYHVIHESLTSSMAGPSCLSSSAWRCGASRVSFRTIQSILETLTFVCQG